MVGIKEEAMQARVFRGLSWKFASQLVLQVTRIGLAVALARLLTPHAYGLAGMVLVVASFVLIFSDFGLGAALVQREHITDTDCSTLFWTTVAAGAVFAGIGFAVAGPVAAFYRAPSVEPLFSVLALSFLLSGLGTVQRSLLVRSMDFRKLEMRSIAATVASAAAAIALAAAGFGAWAIIAQVLTMDAVSTIFLWTASPWRPRFAFSLASLKKFGGFGLNAFGTRLLSDVNENADTLLIGRFTTPSLVGAYSLAYNITLLPANRIVSPVQQVLFPAFSRMQHDAKRVGDAWVQANVLIAAVSLPALGGLIVSAPDFVPLVLGERWHRAIPVVQILAWVGIVESLQRLNLIVLQARDRTRTLLRFSVAAVGANLVAFAIGVHWGIVGVAACYAVSVTVFLPIYMGTTARAVDTSIGNVARRLKGVVEATAAMTIVLVGTRILLQHEDVARPIRLLVGVATGVVVFLVMAAWRAPELGSMIRAVARARGGRTEAPAAIQEPGGAA
jgi:O-antigen/teichoic acid export membrane protein